MVQKLKTFDKGLKPMERGIFHPLIETQLNIERDAEGPRPTAAGTRMRASYALKCARQVGFDILQVPETEPIPTETLIAFEIGQAYHDRLQEIAKIHLGAEIEEVIDLTPLGIDCSCHADFTYEMEFPDVGMATVIGEIKSISGYGWLVVTGLRKSDEGAGPKDEHVVQATIAALGKGAQFVHMVYVDKDKHGIAEFVIDIDEQLPRYEGMSLRELAEAELDRMRGILSRLDNEMLPARHVPGFGRVENVPDVDSKDQPWQCRYCRWNRLCADLAPTPIPLEGATWLPMSDESSS